MPLCILRGPSLSHLMVCAFVRVTVRYMLHKNITEQIGRYVVTPLTQPSTSGKFLAAVSIRRGTYDRVIRFVPQFSDESLASSYALTEGRNMVLSQRLN